MAIKKIQKNRLNESGEFDVIHYETEASITYMSDGTNVEDAINNVQSKLVFDEVPTENSANPVTSGGMYDALSDKQNVITGDQGQVVGFDENGNPVAQDAPSTLPEGTDGQILQYDADGNAQAVDAPFLPLSGGTLTDALSIEAAFALFAIVSSGGGASLGMLSNSLLGNIITHTGVLKINASDGSNVSFGESTLKDIGTPVDNNDAATKGYVDALKPKAVSVTLTAAGWSNNAQTITVNGVLADETAQLIQPMPSTASQAAYIEAGILCTGQDLDSLTFMAANAPTEDLTVYVVITEVTA